LVGRIREEARRARNSAFPLWEICFLNAADALESLARRNAELERGEILTDKELVGAVIECVMSVTQSNRDLHCRKLQRHILAVEAERDAREAECESLARDAERMREALTTLRLDAQTTIDLYNRNGPQWTTRTDGSEYYDASYVIDGAEERITAVDAALAPAKEST